MEKNVQLEIPLLLPEVKDERDQCVDRLLERMKNRRGIIKAHVDKSNGKAFLCLHYDQNRVSLSEVQRWAKEAGAEVTERYRHESIRITDMGCADCASSIEHILNRKEGVVKTSVNYAAEKLWVEYDTTLTDHDNIVEQVHNLGYTVEEGEKKRGLILENIDLFLSLASGFLLATAFFGELFFGLPHSIAVGIYVIAYITGGWDAARHGIKAAMKMRFDVDFLMVVAALGAASLGQWPEGAFLLFLFSLGHALEHYATERARNAINALGEITPKSARIKRDGTETELPVEKLERGDLVIVRPGERIPVDGEVADGESTVDESPITGESVPIDKSSGARVFAGSVNGDGGLEVTVTKLARDTTLARVIQMVEEAQTQKSPTQLFTQKVQRIFVPAILVVVVLMIISPPLMGWISWQAAFLRAMAVLVASSPCALAIATPSAVLSAIASSARNGLLIKGGVHLENLGNVRAIALDKTGTITEGKLKVTDIKPQEGNNEDDLLRVAASVESRSGHPLAQAILAAAQEKGLELNDVEDLQSTSGKGVEAQLKGKKVTIGNLKMFEGQIPDSLQTEVRSLQEAGKTTVIVKRGDEFLGIIGLADQPRASARDTVARLKKLGIEKLVMITGDNERVAAAIAGQVGIDDYEAGLLPEEKVEAVNKLVKEYGKVAMVGDGVNDAPAMTAATVGIAMGAGGTDVALETADVALMADDLSKLPFAVGLSRKSTSVIRQNLWIALGVIAVLIPAALFGLAGIGIAIVLHEGSTLVVVANSLRLLRYRE